ncbi:hypothetical protein L7F22_056914 [Adiantum nelumboides]|nr:hypothetical protein [Adiantum nelumboides]
MMESAIIAEELHSTGTPRKLEHSTYRARQRAVYEQTGGNNRKRLYQDTAQSKKPEGMKGLVDYTNYEDMKYAIRKLDDSEFRNRYTRAFIRVHESRDGASRRSRSRSLSRSRSRSRARSVSKSRSRSQSRGRASPRSRSGSPSVSRSPSRSPSHKRAKEHISPRSRSQSPSKSRSESRSPA